MLVQCVRVPPAYARLPKVTFTSDCVFGPKPERSAATVTTFASTAVEIFAGSFEALGQPVDCRNREIGKALFHIGIPVIFLAPIVPLSAFEGRV